MQAPETLKKNTRKVRSADTNMKVQNPGSVAFYDTWPGNGAGLFL